MNRLRSDCRARVVSCYLAQCVTVVMANRCFNLSYTYFVRCTYFVALRFKNGEPGGRWRTEITLL